MSEENNIGKTIGIWIGSIIAVIIISIIIFKLLRWYIQGGQFRNDDLRIDGKIVIVTGCNTGIGKETVLDLARRGAKIYMACRDYNKCEEARMDIIEQSGNTNIINCALDLSSLESVRLFAKKFLEQENHLDILILNAGVAACPQQLTKDNYEWQIGVNHLGHFLLTKLLLESCKSSPSSRIIVVSSLAHRWGEINREDFLSEKSYDKFKAYCNSKLANILFARHLSKKLQETNVTINSCHPGAVRTDGLRHINPILLCICKPMIMLFYKTPVSGAQTTIYLALDPDLDKVTGKYFGDCREQQPSAKAKDDESAEWLWMKSEELIRLTNKTA